MPCAIIGKEAIQGESAEMLDVRMAHGKRILLWLMLLALAALITWFAFRGYLSPEMLFDFANTFSC